MSETAAPAEKWVPPPVGSPCWVEIPASDVQACKAFYSQLFPSWTFRPATAEYPEEKVAMWVYGGKTGLTGGILHVPAESKNSEQKSGVGITLYHFVESIEDAKKRVEELGGTTESEKIPEGENGYYMYFKDVAGNRFGVYQVKQSAS